MYHTYTYPPARVLPASFPRAQVSVEAVKTRGVLKWNLVALDILPSATASGPAGKPELILVAGKPEKLGVRGTLRGFLQSERATYIAQEKTVSDEELMAEAEVSDAEEAALKKEQDEAGIKA